MMGFGMSTVFPDWFALQHQVPVGAASSILAMANLAMIPGGLSAGCACWPEAAGMSAVLAILMLLAMAVSVPLFMPGHSQPLRIAAMVIWLMTQGAAIARGDGFALPRVVTNPTQGAAAAGLLSQIAAITTFVTPLIWRPYCRAATGCCSWWWWYRAPPRHCCCFRGRHRRAFDYHGRGFGIEGSFMGHHCQSCATRRQVLRVFQPACQPRCRSQQ